MRLARSKAPPSCETSLDVAASRLARAEVGVVALGAALGVVGVGEHRDARPASASPFASKERSVVVEDVHALLGPFARAAGPALAARGPCVSPSLDVRRVPTGHHRAPDVLQRLHRPLRVGEDRVDREGAVVRLGIALVGALRKLDRPPRPGQDRDMPPGPTRAASPPGSRSRARPRGGSAASPASGPSTRRGPSPSGASSPEATLRPFPSRNRR